MARTVRVVTVQGVTSPDGLSDDQWNLLEPVFCAPGKRGRKHDGIAAYGYGYDTFSVPWARSWLASGAPRSA